MNPEYQKWIDDYRNEHKRLAGYCLSASDAMTRTFPELRLERGYVVDKDGWYHQHWWCVGPDNTIYDPTAPQFVDIVRYEAYDEEVHGPLPTGKCMDCGEYIYNGGTFCDENCERATMAYLNNPYDL